MALQIVIVEKYGGGWTIRTADAAHQLILSAGKGNAVAKGQLDAIKAAAAEGDPTAIKIMKYFAPIARMVRMNLGAPSALARKIQSKRQQGPRPAQKLQVALQKSQQQIRALRVQQAQRAKQELYACAKAGVNGTPALFINGRFLQGVRSYEEVVAVIGEEIQKKSPAVPAKP
jgi:hypothetical protein